MTTNDPILRRIRRIAGEAGYVTYDVELPSAGGGARHFTFSGNIFAGPVLLTVRDERDRWHHEVIEEPRRFGEFFSTDWVSEYLDSWRQEHLLDERRSTREST